jgi:hypothetical protein
MTGDRRTTGDDVFFTPIHQSSGDPIDPMHADHVILYKPIVK